jgi:hypothetical protein
MSRQKLNSHRTMDKKADDKQRRDLLVEHVTHGVKGAADAELKKWNKARKEVETGQKTAQDAQREFEALAGETWGKKMQVRTPALLIIASCAGLRHEFCARA